MNPTSKPAIGLLALFLIPFFGCSANRAYVAAPCSPPAVYMQAVEEPYLRGRTNRDLAAWALDLRDALRRSNLDKLHLREWLASRSPDETSPTSPPEAVPPEDDPRQAP
jgi:hypothetical protein